MSKALKRCLLLLVYSSISLSLFGISDLLETEIALLGSIRISCLLLSERLGEADRFETEPDLLRTKPSGEIECFPDTISLLDTIRAKEKLGGLGDDSLEAILKCPFLENGGCSFATVPCEDLANESSCSLWHASYSGQDVQFL